MHMFYVTDMCPAKNICDTRDILKISSLKLGAQRIAICKMDYARCFIDSILGQSW